ncbi:glycoside hydrolase family 17 protein [Piedraia hortae CBS 480.64]|uniref:Probable glucan endo-1,3-beta-glucosidase eglC n=1 Tax=Piedraia hortae CBS 480.64 TaxID=1314780 RepID=A0A6A7C7V7_9PEZI|nr:glycoside hydrolase family 17 protein [Piedraia hortae CBS 480.64]
MARLRSLAAVTAAVRLVQAVNTGFNYGAIMSDGSAKSQAEFEAEFNRAKSLQGTDGIFTSARIYTTIQAGTPNTPISAIPAAIKTKTSLLLGLWASAGPEVYANELIALKAAISQYGSAFTDLVVGISVGSEDLYRISPTGIENHSGVGIGPDVLVKYIQQLRSTVKGTALAKAPVGHVDTWTAWINGTNSAVVDALDWVGMDTYPYFQTTMENSIETANHTFFAAYDVTIHSAKGKPVWVTETGWPVSGPKENLAEASAKNAEKYWYDVACTIVGNVNTWWYTLRDAEPTTPNPSFGIVPSDLNAGPLYNLSCHHSSTSATHSHPTEPNRVCGKSYNVTINSHRNTLLNFDIPASYEGKTCSLVMLLPEHSQLQTSAYTFNNKGGITVNYLTHAVTEKVTYNSMPKDSHNGVGKVESVRAGGKWVLTSSPCKAGTTQCFELVGTGGLELEFFQDYNPSPIGVFVTAC